VKVIPVHASAWLLLAAFTTDAGVVQGDENAVTIQTVDGHFLTAVNGGGVGGPNSGPDSAAIHTDAAYPAPGPWETFTCVSLGKNRLAFQTQSGSFLTAVNAGGMGGPNANPYQIHTDVPPTRAVGPWEQFRLVRLEGSKCALQTKTGFWLTAVNGGGWGEAANRFPIHTDARRVGPWETFTINPR
jgi:hypothetical protein